MNAGNKKNYSAIVIGVSTGGLKALEMILPELPLNDAMPVVVVQHRGHNRDDFFCTHLDGLCALRVQEAEEKMPIQSGSVYIAPADYHLQVEEDRTFSLSVDPLVHYARPSVDVLFETAAEVYREKLVGVVLTGANRDGAAGLLRIKELGGLTVIQEPETACAPEMPQAAIDAGAGDLILPLEEIGSFLARLDR